MTFRYGIAAMIAAATLAGCAPTTQRPDMDSAAVEAERLEQQKMVVTQAMNDSRRLYRVANRIAIAGTELCERKGWRMGFVAHTITDFPEPQRKAAAAALPGLNDDLMITIVVPGSSGEKAGLREGDHLVKIAGKDAPRGKDASNAMREMLKDTKTGDTVPLVVRRDGSQLELPVAAVAACPYSPNLQDKPDINAFADGERVIFTTGMMRFIQSDDELALVMGHEFAHNFRGHIDAKRGNATAGQVIGTLLDILAAAGGVNTGGAMGNSLAQLGAGAFSQGFEAEADYAGLYVMARAGYPIDDAPNFWRRMAVANPNGITHASSHPATPERFVALGATIREIKEKQATGRPLLPNEKPVQTADPAKAPTLNLPQ